MRPSWFLKLWSKIDIMLFVYIKSRVRHVRNPNLSVTSKFKHPSQKGTKSIIPHDISNKLHILFLLVLHLCIVFVMRHWPWVGLFDLWFELGINDPQILVISCCHVCCKHFGGTFMDFIKHIKKFWELKCSMLSMSLLPLQWTTSIGLKRSSLPLPYWQH